MFGGGVWPVVQRELRAAARWPLGRWLRVGGALGGIVAFWISADVPFDQMGVELFERLHTLLLWLICALVPALTADSLARERREGTLGLLFMTPLTASGIVLGKSLAQMLRALTVWLAVMPVLTIPFLTGGVTWADVFSFLVIELCVGFLCLAAGILASSLTDNRAIAFILAFLFMGAFVAESNQDWWLLSAKSMRINGMLVLQNGAEFDGLIPSPFFPNAGSAGFVPRFLPASIIAEIFIITVIILLAALRFAGWRVKRSWQDQIPSARRQNWLRRYCTPVFKRWFARSMRRALERNPIAWLQQYSLKARLTKWGLCLLVIILECAVLNGNQYYHGDSQVLTNLLLILAAAYTLAGVNGFFQEKRNGALELILVSTLSIKQIIFGRVWGLWKQFFPATILLVLSDIAIRVTVHDFSLFYTGWNNWGTGWDNSWMLDLEIVAIYLTLPIVATCFALIAKNLFMVSALTVVMVFGPASVLLFGGFLNEALFSSAQDGSFMFGLQELIKVLPLPPVPVCVMVAHACSGLFAYSRLRRILTRRSYSF